jgi:bacterioferritin-associated ferredoxin
VLVCHCNRVRDDDIRACVREGASSVAEVKLGCRAGTRCGGCLPMVERLVRLEICALAVAAGSPAPEPLPAVEPRPAIPLDAPAATAWRAAG